jgi:hypothetical protein
MPKRSKKNLRKRAGRGSGNQDMRVTTQLPWGGSMTFPIPKLPFRIAAGNHLNPGLAVYPRVSFSVMCSPQLLAVAAGAIASVITVSNALVPSWSSRFQSLFREYAIVGARFEFRLITTAIPQGEAVAFLDEKVNTAPTAADAQTRPHIEIPLVGNPNTNNVETLLWKPLDYTDLEWNGTNVANTPVFCKVYADNANFGTANTTVAQILVNIVLQCEFRGYV